MHVLAVSFFLVLSTSLQINIVIAADTIDSTVDCLADTQECPDGSSVGRDPNNKCQFFPCPQCPFGVPLQNPTTGIELYCGLGGSPCPSGSYCSVHPTDIWAVCCAIVCTADAKICPDGSSVGRDPDLNCAFPPCPCPGNQVWVECGSACTPTCDIPFPICTKQCVERCQCPSDLPILHNGTCITELQCLAECESDWKPCPGGFVVFRDPANNCNFPPCPCPPDKPEVSCFVDPCDFAKKEPEGCFTNETTCEAWYCGACNIIWYTSPEKNEILECDGCPPDKPLSSCFDDPCDNAIQPDCFDSNPNAVCFADYCGGCFAMWWLSSNKQYMLNCDLHSCPENLVWNQCGSACTPNCTEPNPGCTRQCVPRCECPPELPIFENGKCIAQDECPCPDGGFELIELDCNSRQCPRNEDGTPSCSADQKCCLKDRLTGICHILDHLKNDYLRFLDAHKELITNITIPGTKAQSETLDEIWRVLDCLNDLICSIEEKKKKMLDVPDLPDFKSDIASLVAAPQEDEETWLECLMKIIGEILGKTSQLRDLVTKLEQLQFDVDTVGTLVGLINTCLEPAQDLPLFILSAELGASVGPIPQGSNSGVGRKRRDVGDFVTVGIDPICQKVWDLFSLRKELTDLFTKFRLTYNGVFQENDALKLYPSTWMYDFCKCILELIRLTEKFRECCESQDDLTDAEMAKKFSKLLDEAMRVREVLRDCLATISANGVKFTIKKLPGRMMLVDGESVQQNNYGFSVGQDLENMADGILESFDDCIRKIECLYIDYVVSWWTQG